MRDETSSMTGTSPIHTPVAEPPPESRHQSTIIMGFRVVNIGLCVFMAAVAVLSILGFGNVNGNQLSEFFVALYLMLFAATWFTFEVMQIQPVDYIIHHLKRNFGFLFHPIGKALFIIFVAFLNFGVQDDTLGIACGVLCIADGVILIVLYLKYPQWHPKQ